LGQPPAWFALLAEALRQDAAGQHAAAAELRARALAEAPATAAEADGEPISGIRDTDERLGPVLEVVVNGHYHWLPFAHLRRLEIDPPRRLLDLVWCKVRLTLANGANLGGFIPVRYPGSEASDDPGFRLSRRTEWFRLGEDGSEVALGARTFTSDQGDRALLDLRELVLAGSAPVEI
jgi:type VI secretion system protein ImpE